MEYQIESSELLDVIKAVESISQKEALALHGEDRWVTKTRDPAGYAMVATRVTEEVMDGYDQGSAEEIGLKLDPMKSFIDSNSSTLSVALDEKTRKLYVREGDYQLEMGTIAPEYVSGKEQNFPDGDHDVTIEGDLEFVYDFVQKADDTLGTDHIVIGARENNFYLFALKDDKTLVFDKSWDEFDNVEIDKSDFPIDVILAVDYVSKMHAVNADDSTLGVKNKFPVKFMFETDAGIPITYFVAPRTSDGSSDNAAHKVPDSALNEEDKEEL